MKSARRIAWLGGVFLAAIVAQAAWEVVQSHRATVAATERELDAQARVIAEQTARAVQAIDVMLGHLVEQLRGGGTLAGGSPEALHDYLRERAQGLVQTDGLVIFAADGSLRAVSQVPPAQMRPHNYAEEEPFKIIRDSAGTQRGELFVDTARISPGSGRWVFPIGRRVADAQGRFAGVVGGVGRVEYFQQFYREAFADPSTRISLVHRGGTLLARHPAATAALGKPIQGLAALLPPDERTAAQHRIPSPIDGTDHFVALRLVPGYPLALAVSRDAASALAPWRAQALATAARTLALAALAALLLATVQRQIERLDGARRSLEISEARYALAMTGSDEGHWLWDLPARQVYVSARLAQLMRVNGGAQVMPDDEYFVRLPLHPDDRERVHENRRNHVAGLTPRLDHEFRIVDPESGEVRWIHTRAQLFRDAEGRPLHLAGSTVDITRRKRDEMALVESEERYALAMSGLRGGHWVWDARSDGLFVAPAINEIFGLPPGEQPATRAAFRGYAQLDADDKQRVWKLMNALAAGEQTRADYELPVRAQGGGTRWTLTRAQRFVGADGGVRIAGVSIDITERKAEEAKALRLEQQLRQAQKLEAIGTLAGGIAHDFNNILAAILGYGELVQRAAPEGSAQRRHTDAMLAAAQRAKSLVERILAFSRSGLGERVPVHVQSVLEEAVDAVAATLPPGVTLARHITCGDAGLLGDPTQLHQVVLNLCANAVQAMKGRSGDLPLTVSAERHTLAAARPVATSTLEPGEYVCLAVSDRGSGIAPALLERIFDPFFTTKEIGVGTGLGLSLVHGIVADLGGGIAVASEPGAGSCFSVWLPVQPGLAAAPQAAADAVPPALGDGQCVLVVDDEEALVRLAEEMLAEAGYEPVGYTSSAVALEAVRAEPERFDALLSDEAMPGLTGTELVAALRAFRPELPVVLASGVVTPALVQRARELGVHEVLAKPMLGAEVARALASALSSAKVTT